MVDEQWLEELKLQVAIVRLHLALKKYNPDQPRWPSGRPDGGQWRPAGGGSEEAAYNPGNAAKCDAQKLLEEKARFRDLEHAYSATHLARLSDNTVQSIETSSLHIDLISELKRINSLLCSVAYPILESAGALAPSRLRTLNEQV